MRLRNVSGFISLTCGYLTDLLTFTKKVLRQVPMSSSQIVGQHIRLDLFRIARLCQQVGEVFTLAFFGSFFVVEGVKFIRDSALEQQR